MTRGVLYLTFDGGEPRVFQALERSIGSLRQHHPDMEVHEQVFVPGSLLDKARMLDISPFDTTLFLDADTVVLGDISYIFDRAEKFGLACAICECPWARRYPGQPRDLVEFNTGVIGFTRDAAPVFDLWKQNIEIDSSIRFLDKNKEVQTMPHNDQAAFAVAVEQSGFNPWVLPMNYNFRQKWQKTAFGEVRIWHDYADVPDWLHKWNAEQTSPGAVISCGGFA